MFRNVSNDGNYNYAFDIEINNFTTYTEHDSSLPSYFVGMAAWIHNFPDASNFYTSHHHHWLFDV